MSEAREALDMNRLTEEWHAIVDARDTKIRALAAELRKSEERVRVSEQGLAAAQELVENYRNSLVEALAERDAAQEREKNLYEENRALREEVLSWRSEAYKRAKET